MRGKLFLFIVFGILISCNTVFASPTWVSVYEDQDVVYLVDKDRLQVTDDENKKLLDMWVKFFQKKGDGNHTFAGAYDICHYAIKSDYSYRLLERSHYRADNSQEGTTFVNQTDRWLAPTKPQTPLGKVATYLFAKQQEDPQLQLTDSQERGEIPFQKALPALIPVTNSKEWQQAITDGRIKAKADKEFIVEDTYTIYYFLEKNHATFDFALVNQGQGNYKRGLYFTLQDPRAGTHQTGREIVLNIDGKPWKIDQPFWANESGTTSATFYRNYFVSGEVAQAILDAKVLELKWRYSHNGEWKDFRYEIPAKILKDIQLLYKGGAI